MARISARHVTLLACLTVAVLAGGCGGNPDDRNVPQVTAPMATSPSVTETPSARLVWTSFGKSLDLYQATFVVRVSNPTAEPVSGITLEIHALDASGTIVGSKQATMPTLSPRSQFEYLGTLGATAFSQLTGKPAKIETAMASDTNNGQAPLLKTSELKLRKGDRSFTDAPYAYDLTVKVTNDTGQILDTPVHQQVILYDSAGHIAGGGEGSSDNQPETLAAGSSYREEWTGIAARRPATLARYSVWPEQ